VHGNIFDLNFPHHEGDINPVFVGDDVSIGEKSSISTANALSKIQTKIGNKVFIGPGVSIDSSTLDDSSFVGEGSVVLAGSKIGKQAVLVAGSVLPAGSSVPAGQVWSGSPATYLRDVTAADIESIAKLIRENRNLASAHARESSKSWLEIEEDQFDYQQTIERNEYYYKRLTPEVIANSILLNIILKIR